MPQLTWLGDDDAKRAARRVPYRMPTGACLSSNTRVATFKATKTRAKNAP